MVYSIQKFAWRTKGPCQPHCDTILMLIIAKVLHDVKALSDLRMQTGFSYRLTSLLVDLMRQHRVLLPLLRRKSLQHSSFIDHSIR